MTGRRAGMSLGLAVLGAWMTFPNLLAAQTCLGAPSLADRFANLDASAGFYEGDHGLGIGLTLGSSLFVEIDYVREDHEDHAQPQDTFRLGAGFEFGDDDGRFGICPTASYGLSSGIYEFRTRHAEAGIAIGFRSSVSESLSLVPFGELMATWSQTHFPIGPELDPDWAGLVVLGTRVETSPSLSFGPTVRLRFAAEEGEAIFGSGLGLSVVVGL